MTTTAELIVLLSEQAAAVKPAPKPAAVLAGWMVGCLGYIAVLLFFMGLRGDLSAKLESPLYLIELGLLCAIMLSTAFSAIALSVPDMYQSQVMARGFIVPLVLFTAFLGISLLEEMPYAQTLPHGLECLACITLLSLLPAAWITAYLCRQASTHYRQAGMAALLTAASIGCLVLRLSEANDSFLHLALWHYLPLAGFGIAGLWVGKKFLKW